MAERACRWILLARTFLICAIAGLVPALNTPVPVAVWVALAGVVLAAGSLALGSVAEVLLRRNLSLELRLLIGFVVLLYSLALPVHLLHVPIALAAAAFLMVALFLVSVLRRRGPAPEGGEELASILALLAAAGFAAIWSLESTHRAGELTTTGIFRLWVDFFSHAAVIAEFGDPRAVGRQSTMLADVPEGFYHFVSFALPALAVRLLDMTPLNSVTAIWLPAGIFATTLGVMALGQALVGPAGSALALLLLVACPDSASYGLRQGFLSFHWMLETAPGSLYALPCACAALCLLVPWCREADTRSLIGSSLLLAAVFLLRAHVFIWLAGPWAATALVAWRRCGHALKLAFLVAGAVVAAVGMMAVGRAEIARTGLLAYVSQFISFLHLTQGPTGYDGLYPRLVELLGSAGALAPGLVLAWLAMGGLPMLTFLIGAAVLWRQRRLEALDLLPGATLLWAGLLMLFAPTPFQGDFTEFRQRGFVLVVVLLLVWNARFLVLLAPGWTGRRAATRTAALASCAMLPLTAAVVKDWKAPRMKWGATFVATPVAPEVIAAAAWLRHAAGPASAFTIDRIDDSQVLFDLPTALVGMSGVPAWLARGGLQIMAGGTHEAVARQRITILADVAAAPDRATAFAPLRAARVDFYIASGMQSLRWDPDHATAAFHSGALAIYRTSQAGDVP